MEAFLLMLDIALMVSVCWLAVKAAKSKDGLSLGYLDYKDVTGKNGGSIKSVTKMKESGRA